jgi:uncharacterized protein (TIGR03545 family)
MGKPAEGKKPVKKQGPIRVEAVVPMLIVVGAIVLYFSVFFDAHLRRGLEYGATQANGAEVNIGKLQTSVFKASVLIGDVQMTDPLLPEHNRVQIGEVRFRMLWDALLRGKVMIDEATIENVQIDTPRKQAGRVLPPPPPSESGPSASDKMMAKMKEEFSGNVVGDLAAIAAGANPSDQLKQIGGDLKSDAYMAELQRAMDETEQQWKTRMAALPRGEDFSALRTRLGNVKVKDVKDAAQLQTAVKELQAIRDEFEAKSKPIGEAGSSLSGDLKGLQTSFAGLDDVVRQDVRGLQSRMKLPSLDAGNLSRALFGMDMLGKLQQARGYMEQARQYIPAKSKQAAKPAPRNIHKGRDYAFGHPKGYPAFWLRRAMVTSTLPGGKGLSGEIRDAATDQALVGRPMTATLKGDFPQQGVAGVKAELVVDHTKSEPLERMELSVVRYGVAGRSLVNSPNVTLGFAQAAAAAGFTAELRGEQVAIQASNKFRDVDFALTAQSTVVREMMNVSLAGLQTVSMDAKVHGTWGDLKWNLSTNLGDALASGMKRYLQEKMDAARKQIQAQVDQSIAAQRQKLMARRSELESRLKSALADKQAQVDKLRADLEAARRDLEQRKNAATDAQKQKIKQDANKLLDKWRR